MTRRGWKTLTPHTDPAPLLSVSHSQIWSLTITSTGSTWELGLRVAWFPALLFCFLLFADAPPLWILFWCGLVSFQACKDYIRRRSLHQREDGVYVWVEWSGAERCSSEDPSEAGGLWDSEGGDGDGGGD